MNRFVTGFVTGLLSGLAVAAVAMLWLKVPSAERLEHTSALQAPAVPQAPAAAAAPIAVAERLETHVAPPVPERASEPAVATSQAASEKNVVPVPVHELLVDVLRARDEEGNRFPNPVRPLHERLEREEKDPVWAPYMEWHLREYIGRQPGVQAQRIEVPVLECRATLCEIQAHADVEDRSREADWQRIAANMRLEPWWNEFVDATHNVSAKNTRVTYVTFLFRRSPL